MIHGIYWVPDVEEKKPEPIVEVVVAPFQPVPAPTPVQKLSVVDSIKMKLADKKRFVRHDINP
jgi:hypothetical protein